MMLFEKFANQAIQNGRFAPLDEIYVMNKVRALVGDEDIQDDGQHSIVEQLVATAIKNGKIDDGITAREILSDQLYDLLTPTPAKVNAPFGISMLNPQKRQLIGFITYVHIITT